MAPMSWQALLSCFLSTDCSWLPFPQTAPGILGPLPSICFYSFWDFASCWFLNRSAIAFGHKHSWSPLTASDLFATYTSISAPLQEKNLNFNENPTKTLIAVGIILWFLFSHTLIPSGKRFYLPSIKMKSDRQPSNQSTSQKMSDYSRKQHLTA